MGRPLGRAGTSMPSDSAKPRLRAFLARTLRTSRLEDDDDIFEVGSASSLFAMELVLFIEETLGIALDDGDLERDNLSSIAAIAALVARKRNDSE